MSRSVALLLASLFVVSCGDRREATPPRGSGPLRAVCTTTIVADLVREVGGQDVEVTTLIDPGEDPHRWRPSKSDRDRLEQADIIFMVGLGLEERAEKMLLRTAGTRTVVAIADSLHPVLLIPDPADEERFDPHVWLDPALWNRAGYLVGLALGRADPSHQSAYAGRADNHAGTTGVNTHAIETALNSVPEERRVLATTHEGYGYFAREFRWQTISPAVARAETRGRVKGDPLVELLVTRRIPVLFIQNTETRERADQLSAEARKRGHEVRVVTGLHADGLDGPGTGAETWAEAQRIDVEAIVTALR